ncbi:MAG: arsenate reductase family protein [Bacilli bacterium]|nr:arsenate reductase family protein [Bacilli bacterium]
MSIQFVWYPNCGTCRAAKKTIEQSGELLELRHIVQEPLTAAELKKWIPLSGLPIRKWFNVSGNRYKELGLKDKLPALSDDEMIDLLASDGMLVKRPVIRKGNKVQVGFQDGWQG